MGVIWTEDNNEGSNQTMIDKNAIFTFSQDYIAQQKTTLTIPPAADTVAILNAVAGELFSTSLCASMRQRSDVDAAKNAFLAGAGAAILCMIQKGLIRCGQR